MCRNQNRAAGGGGGAVIRTEVAVLVVVMQKSERGPVVGVVEKPGQRLVVVVALKSEHAL